MEPLELPDHWENLITGYVLGDLSSEEAALVKQYLELYPELAVEVESLQATLAVFPLSLPETKPPEKLRSQILEAAKTELNQNEVSLPISSSPHPPISPSPSKPWLKIAGITAMGIIAGLGFFNYRL